MRLLAITAIAAASLLLAGCSTNPSSITLTYEQDGAEHTLDLKPDTVKCSDDNVHGISVTDGPGSFYSFDLINGTGEGKVSVTVSDRDGDSVTAVQFDAEKSSPNTGTDGVYTLKSTPGTVLLIEDYDANVEYDRSDLTELEGTVAAELHCDTDE